MASFLKLNVGSLIIMGIFMIFSTAHSVECRLNDEVFNYLEEIRPDSCKDWPYNDPHLSQSSCQECVDRLADVCWFINDTPMSLEQKEKLDKRCKDLQQE